MHTTADLITHRGGCHCGRVKYEVDAPAELEAYEVRALAEDVRGLIDAVSDRPVLLVGHDWGGAVAWLVAHTYPERLAGLIIINAPHPDVFARELAENPDQLSAAGYMNTFLNPLVEDLLAVNDYELMMDTIGGSLPAELHDYYREAYARPGRLWRVNELAFPPPRSARRPPRCTRRTGSLGRCRGPSGCRAPPVT